MSDNTSSFWLGLGRFIGCCIILPPIAGGVGFFLGAFLIGNVYEWFWGPASDAAGLMVVIVTPIVTAGAALLAGLAYVAVKGGKP